jgi:hypothetical protein
MGDRVPASIAAAVTIALVLHVIAANAAPCRLGALRDPGTLACRCLLRKRQRTAPVARRAEHDSLIQLSIVSTTPPTRALAGAAGVLKAAPGAVWQQNRTTFFNIFVGDLAEPRQQKLSGVPPTPLESGLVAELRPPLPPSTRPRLCLRSLAAAVAGAGGACAVKGLATSGSGVLGAPHTSWACMEVAGAY